MRMVTPDRAMPNMAAGSRNMPRLPRGSSKNGMSSVDGDQPHKIEG